MTLAARRRRGTGLARHGAVAALGALALLLAGCQNLPFPWLKREPPATAEDGKPAEGPRPEGARVGRTITPQTPEVRAWRKVAAEHIYKAYPKRIFKGKIPPLVYAVVVVETEVGADGKVTSVNFSRVPSHAPEVPPKIAALIQAMPPFPSPGKLGAHTYVDTWLWDRSDNFQLDTLTVGQLSTSFGSASSKGKSKAKRK